MTRARPLIAAAIIVKNEAEHLRRCLGSIQVLCDEIVVVDTGSTDNTVAIASSFGAVVRHKPWKNDFAASRNVALDTVTAEWVLYIDADEELVMNDVTAIRDQIERAEDVMAFGLNMHSQVNWTPYTDFRLWRHRDDIRFVGEIHESTMGDITRVARETGRILRPIAIDILHHGYEGDLSAKHRRNLPLLLAELEVHPEKINLWNHLGRVQLALGRPDLAERAWRNGIERVESSGPIARFDVQIYASYADFLISQGRDARSIIDRGRALDPTFKTLQWLWVRQSMSRGEFVQAIEGAEELIRLGEAGGFKDGVAYNLDMFSAWPRRARIDCLFELMRFDEVRESIVALAEPIDRGSRRAKQLEVCVAHEAWRAVSEGSSNIATPVRLDDVTFVIPVRIESADRLANVLALTRQLVATYDCRVLIGCEQPDALRSVVSDSVDVVAVEGNPDDPFHTNRLLNELSRLVETPLRVHCDVDSLVPIDQMLEALRRVRTGSADMVLPYLFGIGVPVSERDAFARGDIRIERLVRPRPMVGIPAGLCQVWTGSAFRRFGMENEYLIGWAPEDLERVERLDILGARVERVMGPIFHMDHATVAGRDHSSVYHALSQAERERVADMSRAELETEIRSWPWVTRGKHDLPAPIDAQDLTVVIPVRIDSPDRLRNLVTSTRALLATTNCRILVGIAEPAHVVGSLDSRVQVAKVLDPPEQAFHRTRIINDLSRSVTTAFMAIMDTDVVLSSEQWGKSLEVLRREEAELVYPFDGRMVEVPFATHPWLERGELDALPPSSKRLIETSSLGGCVLFARSSFERYGMENEHFVSWGYEDDERLLRAHKLGVSVARQPGVIFHIEHQRGPDSRPDNPHIRSNANEVQRVKSLSDADLAKEIRGWPWVRERRVVKVLIWNDLWHPDHVVVDPADRGIELIRDRSRLAECDVVVAGLATLDRNELPPPGRATRVLISREATANVPWADEEVVKRGFEVVVGHRRTDDVWWPYAHRALLGDVSEVVPLDKRSVKLASAWMSSKWDSSGRTALLNDLMLYTSVDSYGRVARNIGSPEIRSHVDRWNIAAHYRFFLAFENARETDYVTEKFFEPLVFGSVPVYLGAPNIDEFAPGDKCFVDASEFETARDLAEFLNRMSDDEYLSYHEWRSVPRRAAFVDLCGVIPPAMLSPVVETIRERR